MGRVRLVNEHRVFIPSKQGFAVDKRGMFDQITYRDFEISTFENAPKDKDGLYAGEFYAASAEMDFESNSLIDIKAQIDGFLDRKKA